MRKNRGWYWLLVIPSLSGCTCDDNLEATPQPEAILSDADEESPPEDHVTVGLPPALIGQPVEVTLNVRNEGKAPLEVNNVTLSSDPLLCPGASGAFVIAEPQAANSRRSFELAPGGQRTIRVRFTPSSGASECVVLNVLSNDPDNDRLKALLTGSGDAPRLCTDRVNIDFGELTVGQTADDVVVLNSCGTRALELTGLNNNSYFPPFSKDNVILPVTLDPGMQLSIPVHFQPTEAGQWTNATGRAGRLDFTAANGELYQITLEGRSRQPPSCVMDVVPAQLNFGVVSDGVPHTLQTVLINRGEEICTLTGADVRAPAGQFSSMLIAFSAGMTIAPQQQVTVSVTFTPSTTTGIANNFLDVVTDDPQRPTISVPLEANVPGDQGCQLEVNPATLNFGTVPVGTLRALGVTVRNLSDEFCFINGVSMLPGSSPAFINTSSSFGLIPAGGTKTLTAAFRPTTTGSFTGTFQISTTDDDSPTFPVQLLGRTGVSGICVEPRHLDFGVQTTATTKTFDISACGATVVTVSALEFDPLHTDAEFTVFNAPTLPFTLQPGEERAVTMQYAPADTTPDTAVLLVKSDDAVSPEVPVDMTGGPETVPPAAGRYLYYWQIPGIQGGDVMKFPLQGNPGTANQQVFWGPRNGKACAGCHSVSPDGHYVAVIELGTMRFVEAATGLELNLVNQFLDPQYFSWRPDVNTNPPYQFAYGNGNIIKIAALYDGNLRDLQGANETARIQTMPSWGRTGKIAFVRGDAAAMTTDMNNVGIQGPCDVLTVDENGGTSTPVPGASLNGMANYYPQFAPVGPWIAFTQSAAAQSTIAAEDAQIRMVRADNSGTVLQMATLNGTDGASSYPTWALDGTFLSFSSNRTGGEGDWDIYVAPVSPVTGADGAASNIADLNTSAFEHAAQWSP